MDRVPLRTDDILGMALESRKLPQHARIVHLVHQCHAVSECSPCGSSTDARL